jgi:hypothetical protein
LRETFHDSRRLIDGHPVSWHLSLGVTVHNPIENHAGLGGIKAIDWQADAPQIWSTSSGGCVPYEQRAAKTQQATEYVIERIDTCIATLQAHRQRLVETLEEKVWKFAKRCESEAKA